MPILVVNAMQPHTGFAMLGIAGTEEVLNSHLALDEEFWLALRYPAEASKAGYELLSNNHPGFVGLPSAEKESVWKEFRSFIRQAEGFYRGAAVLPWKSSPLNYYYAFLNLAKAAALARGLLRPQGAGQPRVIHHGVSAKVIPGAPDSWELEVQAPSDMFGLLYSLSLGTTIPKGTKLDAHKLLCYVPAIHWQMSKSGHSALPLRSAYWVLLVNGGTQFRDLIVVDKRLPIDDTPAAFQALYRELTQAAAKVFAWNALKLHAIASGNHRFLERAASVGSVAELETSIRAAAPYLLQENLMEVERQIVLSLPCPTAGGGSAPMSELVAAYGVMYFLSSLVRYQPNYMDHIAESDDSWLIESFAKSAPFVLLRSLTREILGYRLKIIPF